MDVSFFSPLCQNRQKLTDNQSKIGKNKNYSFGHFVFTPLIRNIIQTSRCQAVRSVDFWRVQMYWQIGQRIVEEEQGGNTRAEYGKALLKSLSAELEPEFGSGFSYRQLNFSRQFYLAYPIVNALRSQFNWTQYRILIQIDDKDKREFYELEALNNSWTARELERQVHALLYERLLISSDKDSVLAMARKERLPQTPQEIIKDPMVLEFLGLEQDVRCYAEVEKVRRELNVAKS